MKRFLNILRPSGLECITMVVQQILASVEESYILVLAYLLHIITFQLLNTFVRQGDLMLLFKAIELESRPRVHLSILF